MSVIITIQKNQFTIKSDYNQSIVDWISEQEKRFWDHEQKIWFLPTSVLKDFTQFLNDKDITNSVKEQTLTALVKKVRKNEYECRFSMFNTAFRELVGIPGVNYCRRTKKITMDSKGHTGLKKLCLEKKIEWNEEESVVDLISLNVEEEESAEDSPYENDQENLLLQ